MVVLRHFSAFLLTLATCLGTSSHMFVVGKFFASCGALIATLGATFEHVFRQFTVASAKRRTRFATFSAVYAQLGRCLVLGLSARSQFKAMVETTVAFDLARIANLSTLFHHRISMFNRSHQRRKYGKGEHSN